MSQLAHIDLRLIIKKQIIIILCHGNIFLSTVQSIMHKFEGNAANILLNRLFGTNLWCRGDRA